MRFLLLPFLLFVTCSSSAQSDLPSFIPADGLVGWWPFNGNAKDKSGQNNNGLVTNAQLATDRFGNPNAAYIFNGSNSRIDVADAVSLRVRKITMSAWVKTNTLSGQRQIIYKGSLNADGEVISLNQLGAVVKIGSNCIPGSGWQGTNFSNSLVIDTWQHLAFTYDGTLVTLYKNGTRDTSFAFTGLIDSCIGGGLRFGFNHLRFFSSTGDPFNGSIDDIGMWNRALSPEEISQLSSATSSDCGYGNVGVNLCNPQRNLHVKDVIRLEPRTAAPDNAVEGDIYYDATLHKLRVYDGTSWQNCW